MLPMFFKKQLQKKQSGQALPLGLALIMFGALLTLGLFNTGQMASEKSRLANTADAAVYSGLIWQARALNFQAYTNRAMVANQVTIAQLVSMTSWTNYGRITARNIDNTIGWIPFLKPFTAALLQAMTQVENVVTEVANVAVPIIDGVNQALSQSQRALYVATFSVTPALVREVVKANDSRYNVNSTYAIASLGKNLRDWQGFTTRYEDLNGLNRKADVINRSKDRFTLDRGWSIGKFYLGPTFKFELIKEGKTNLIYSQEQTQDEDGNTVEGDGEWEWKAKDNLSLHVERFKCGWSGCGWRHTEIPIGWGGAYVENDIEACETRTYDDGESQYTEKICPQWMRRNHRGEERSDSEAVQIEGNYSGVQAYYDMRDLSQNNRDPRLGLRIEVQVAGSEVGTSTNLQGAGSSKAPNETTRREGFGEGAFWVEDSSAAGSMASLSSGEVFFQRPTGFALRVNGTVRQEYGSLYNPYWQVRLLSIPQEQRLAAWLLRSPGIVVSAPEGAALAAEAYVQQKQDELQNLQSYIEQGEEVDDLVIGLPPVDGQVGESLIEATLSNIDAADGNASVDSEEYLQPIRDQIVEMEVQRDNVESVTRAEYQAADEAMQAEIDTINNTLDAQVQSLSDAIQAQIDDLTSEQAGLTDQEAIDGLQAQIDLQTLRLASEPQQLRQQLEDRVSDVLNQQQQMSDGIEAAIVAAQSNYDLQITSLTEQLAYLEQSASL